MLFKVQQKGIFLVERLINCLAKTLAQSIPEEAVPETGTDLLPHMPMREHWYQHRGRLDYDAPLPPEFLGPRLHGDRTTSGMRQMAQTLSLFTSLIGI